MRCYDIYLEMSTGGAEPLRVSAVSLTPPITLTALFHRLLTMHLRELDGALAGLAIPVLDIGIKRLKDGWGESVTPPGDDEIFSAGDRAVALKILTALKTMCVEHVLAIIRVGDVEVGA